MSNEQDKIGEATERLAGVIATKIQIRQHQAIMRDEPLSFNDWKTIIAAELTQVEELIRDVAGIANEHILPDGDGVNVPTALWAEDWLRKFESKEKQ